MCSRQSQASVCAVIKGRFCCVTLFSNHSCLSALNFDLSENKEQSYVNDKSGAVINQRWQLLVE